jgi:hypothetical protein
VLDGLQAPLAASNGENGGYHRTPGQGQREDQIPV